MMIQAFPSGPFETNAYVVACPRTRQAAIIDPAPHSSNAISSYIDENQLNPTLILLTHSHWDHIADVANLKAKTNALVAIHPLDVPNLQTPGADQLPCWIDIQGVVPDRLLNEGDTVQIGDIKLTVIHVPGHTPGGVCFYSSDEHILFSGDTLFKGTIGNLSFPTAQPELMWLSLEKLSKLPPETDVYPGHGPSTTIGKEKWLSRAEEIFGN